MLTATAPLRDPAPKSALGADADIMGGHRLLIIDDNPSIHDDFRKILTPHPPSDFDQSEAEFLGITREAPARPHYRIDSAYQGQEGLALVQRALADERSEERRVGKECRSRWSPYH